MPSDTPTARVLARIPGWDAMTSTELIGRLCEILDTCRPDAKRYEHIRANILTLEIVPRVSHGGRRVRYAYRRRMSNYPYDLYESLDAAIDAALAGGEEGKNA